jgi:hypothetical protein
MKYTLLQIITLLLVTAKLFVNYDVTWFEVFIPIYVAFVMESIRVFTEHWIPILEEYIKAQTKLEDKVKEAK